MISLKVFFNSISACKRISCQHAGHTYVISLRAWLALPYVDVLVKQEIEVEREVSFRIGWN